MSNSIEGSISRNCLWLWVQSGERSEIRPRGPTDAALSSPDESTGGCNVVYRTHAADSVIYRQRQGRNVAFSCRAWPATRKCPKTVRLSPYSVCDNRYGRSKSKLCHIQADNSPSVGLEGTEVKMPRPQDACFVRWDRAQSFGWRLPDYMPATAAAPRSWKAAELHRHES
jgi:hypothetical protein